MSSLVSQELRRLEKGIREKEGEGLTGYGNPLHRYVFHAPRTREISSRRILRLDVDCPPVPPSARTVWSRPTLQLHHCLFSFLPWPLNTAPFLSPFSHRPDPVIELMFSHHSYFTPTLYCGSKATENLIWGGSGRS